MIKTMTATFTVVTIVCTNELCKRVFYQRQLESLKGSIFNAKEKDKFTRDKHIIEIPPLSLGTEAMLQHKLKLLRMDQPQPHRGFAGLQ